MRHLGKITRVRELRTCLSLDKIRIRSPAFQAVLEDCTISCSAGTVQYKAVGFPLIRLDWQQRIRPIRRSGIAMRTWGIDRSIQPMPWAFSGDRSSVIQILAALAILTLGVSQDAIQTLGASQDAIQTLGAEAGA